MSMQIQEDIITVDTEPTLVEVFTEVKRDTEGFRTGAEGQELIRRDG